MTGLVAVAAVAAAFAGGAGSDSFTTRIDNPYWPMRPGARWVYRETDDDGSRQKVVVTVTNRTKRVASGIVGRVVRDTVTEDGQLVEDTFDWYAQDRRGNIWYLGEDTTDYEDGRPVSKEGSFEDGVNGARRGIVMLAGPRVGREYREERAPGEAEDEARVLSRDEQVEVPFGHFTNVLMTRNVNPLEPKTQEYKWYARGVGPVMALSVSGSRDREVLVRFRRGRF
ncbi:MAG: hypothetical protein ACXW08_03025 [Solirubrobacteraceae bacterium]